MAHQGAKDEVKMIDMDDIRDNSDPIISDESTHKSSHQILSLSESVPQLSEAPTLVDYSSTVTDSPAKSQVIQVSAGPERVSELIDGGNMDRAGTNTHQKRPRRRGYKLRKDRSLRLQTSENPRPRRICEECDRPVTNLKKHMREMHKKKAPMRDKMFKNPTFTCPLCSQNFVRVDMHLKKKHKLSSDSDEYQRAMGEFYRNRERVLAREDEAESKTAACSDISDDNSSLSTGLVGKVQKAQPERNISDKGEELLPKELRQFKASKSSGGWMTGSQRDTHARQVKNILFDISDGSDVKVLLTPRTIEDWVDRKIKTATLSISTIISYLISLKDFCSYLNDQFGMEEALDIVHKVQRWTRSLRRKKAESDWKRKVKELEQFLEVEDFIKIDQARTTVSALETLNSDTPRAQDAYAYNDVVAFLALKTYLTTGQRSGAVVNMTVDELQVGRKNLQKDLAKKKDVAIEDHAMLVTVINHKTAYISPAVLRIPFGLAQYYFKYLDFLRPQSKDPTVFVKVKAKNRFRATELNALVQKRYSKDVGKTLSATAIRKNVVTKLWEERPELRGMLARVMNHSEKTAGDYYTLPLQMHQSEAIGAVIENIMKQNRSPAVATTGTETTPTTTTTQQTSVFPTTMNISRERRVPKTSTTTSSSAYDPDLEKLDRQRLVPASSTIASSSAYDLHIDQNLGLEHPAVTSATAAAAATLDSASHAASTASIHRRRTFEQDDVTTLFRICNEFLTIKRPPITREVVNLLEKSDEGRVLLSRYNKKQLVDRVRSQIRTLK